MRPLFKKIIVAILTWEAKCVLLRHKPFIVAVTGSVGKTSTKDAIFHVLQSTTTARKSQKSFNSEIGLPLTVLGLENAWRNPLMWLINICKGLLLVILPLQYPKLLVLEVGADHAGDIKRAVQWMKPDIAVVTSLPDRPVHVENFSSPEEVRKEKGELVRALGEHGVFVANADDAAVAALQSTTRARMFTYGFSEGAQVKGSYPEIYYQESEEREGQQVPAGMIFHVDWQGGSFPVKIRGVLGVQSCMSVLPAIAVGLARGCSMIDMIQSIDTLQTPPGRMRIIAGFSGSTIIDDTYNSSPTALEAALLALKLVEANHRIAVLGDMLELGKYSEEEHWKMGRLAGGFVDELVTVGKRAAGVAEGAKTAGLPEGKIHMFTNSQEAGEWLKDKIKLGDVILAKGSQGGGENIIRMERTVKALMANPAEAPNLLVRQEAEWQAQYTPRG